MRREKDIFKKCYTREERKINKSKSNKSCWMIDDRKSRNVFFSMYISYFE